MRSEILVDLEACEYNELVLTKVQCCCGLAGCAEREQVRLSSLKTTRCIHMSTLEANSGTGGSGHASADSAGQGSSGSREAGCANGLKGCKGRARDNGATQGSGLITGGHGPGRDARRGEA